jgi:flagellar biosynthetic protein FliO
VSPLFAINQAPAWTGTETLSAVRGILATVFVLGLLGTLAWALRRGKLQLGSGRARSAVSLETTVSLGERRSLVIVSVEGRRLLLGATPMQLSLLTELAPVAKDSPTFTETLQQTLQESSR